VRKDIKTPSRFTALTKKVMFAALLPLPGIPKKFMPHLQKIFTCTFRYQDGTSPTTATIEPLPIHITKSTGDPFKPANQTTHFRGLEDRAYAESQLANVPVNIEIDCDSDQKLVKFVNSVNAALRPPAVQSFLATECPKKYHMEKHDWKMDESEDSKTYMFFEDCKPKAELLNTEKAFKPRIARLIALFEQNPEESRYCSLTVHLCGGSPINEK
jgi:hypothetical protein